MKRFIWMVVVLLPFAHPTAAQAQLTTKTQNFDSEASASSGGWRGLNNRVNEFDFGFSATNNAQGASGGGEGGGRIVRAGDPDAHAFYADTELGFRSTINQVDLQAGGRIKFDEINYNGEFWFGWFDATKTEDPNEPMGWLEHVGVHVLEQGNRAGWRVLSNINTFNTPPADAPLLIIPDNTVLDFALLWDADGGAAAGEGKLSLTLSTPDGAQSFESILEGTADISVDAFGVVVRPQSGGQAGNFWFDDLSYSSGSCARGDADCDGDVDLDDFQLILDNFFNTVPIKTDGDVTGDGIVDFADFHQWKAVHSAGAGTAAIPEPTTAGLFCLALTMVLLGRRLLGRRRVR